MRCVQLPSTIPVIIKVMIVWESTLCISAWEGTFLVMDDKFLNFHECRLDSMVHDIV